MLSPINRPAGIDGTSSEAGAAIGAVTAAVAAIRGSYVLTSKPPKEIAPVLPALNIGSTGAIVAGIDAANEEMEDTGGLGKGVATTVLRPDGSADGGGITPMRTARMEWQTLM